MSRLASWKQRAARLKRDTLALYLACRDPRVPWYAKVWAALVVAYALSPIDLIPDPIPVLGYLDDLIIVPAGLYIALRLVPPGVMEDCRRRAEQELAEGAPRSWVGAAIIAVVWLLVVVVVGVWVWRALRH